MAISLAASPDEYEQRCDGNRYQKGSQSLHILPSSTRHQSAMRSEN